MRFTLLLQKFLIYRFEIYLILSSTRKPFQSYFMMRRIELLYNVINNDIYLNICYFLFHFDVEMWVRTILMYHFQSYKTFVKFPWKSSNFRILAKSQIFFIFMESRWPRSYNLDSKNGLRSLWILPKDQWHLDPS